MGQSTRTVIAVHLILTLYGHWAVNDPRGSGSRSFHDDKFEPLGAIHHGRKPEDEQPDRDELRAFHQQHQELLNFPVFWIDDEKRAEIAAAIEEVIKECGYTLPCAICGNHIHLVIRTYKHRAQEMWALFAERIRQRLRLRFTNELSQHHPVISARPYNVLLFTPNQVWRRINYANDNPEKEGLPRQHMPFITPYDNWPQHKK